MTDQEHVEERVDEQEERLRRVEKRLKRMLPGRRDFLKGAAVAGVGAAGFGAGNASAELNDGDTQWGSDSNRDDYIVDHVDANVVDTEKLNSVRFVSTDDTREDVNSLLGSSGTVVFSEGTYLYDDRLEVTSSDVSIIIGQDATVGLADSMAPTGVDRGNGIIYPVIYSSGNDNLRIENYGTLAANRSNSPADGGTTGAFVDNARQCDYFGGGEIDDGHDCLWWVDIDGGYIEQAFSRNFSASVVAMEGCRECEVIGTVAEGGPEAIDLNHSNEGCEVRGVYGVDLSTGTGGQIIDVNNSPRTSVSGVRSRGTADTLVSVRDDAGARFTRRTTISHCDDVTVSDVVGTSQSHGIHAYATTSVNGLTLTGFNVESSGGHGVHLQPATAGGLDNATLRGRAVATSTGTTNYQGVACGAHGYQQTGLELSVVGQSANHTGVKLTEWNGITGNVKAHGCPQSGVALASTDSETCDDVSLRVNIKNSGTYGFITAGGGTKTNIHVSGIATGSGTTDIRVEGTEDARIDVQHSTFQRAAGNTCVVVNGWGENAGDPNTTGQWNGSGYEGVNVRDTTNLANYAYVNGGWVAL